MKQFNVLDRHLVLHRHYLLEASAGTGKTFSIQNIVVRLLIEPHGEEAPLLLQSMLIVTFTKAATRDLNTRIRSNIQEALQYLQRWQRQNLIAEQAPDYLKACMEKGEKAVEDARKKLQQALFTFDQAQIFTIHAFCARMLRQFPLESDTGFHSLSEEEPLPPSEVRGVIRDFFRTDVRIENYSPAQLEIVLKEDPDQRKLLHLIQRGYDFARFPSFRELRLKLSEKMGFLKRSLLLNGEKIMEDFRLQAGAYRNDKKGASKADTEGKVARFAKLFDQEQWSDEELDLLIHDSLVWVKALDPRLLKGKKPHAEELNYPNLTESLLHHLNKIIEEARSFPVLLARMARDCRELLKRYQREEEKLAPDDILHKMNEALHQPLFVSKIQANYQAAIIDEFQDTDPLQWKIFRRLFVPTHSLWRGYLYLVGDPKQSIYSFRQADIYTYLAAAQALGESHCFSLDVNHRSQPHLVKALNFLLSPEHLPCFIPLPKTSSSLGCRPVQAAAMTPFEDKRGAIHFFAADGQALKKGNPIDLEQALFFPFIVQEIVRLKNQNDRAFSSFAVLVRDRYQALRLAEYFDQLAIPYLNQRGTSLADSPAHQALKHLVRAVLHPQDRGAMRTLLASPLMGWTHEEVKHMESMEFILLLVHRLREDLFGKGFASFFQEVLLSPCRAEGPTILEQIVVREGGREFYRDLQQIADIVVDHQQIEWKTPEGILPFLNQFHTWEDNEDSRIKRFQDPAIDAVKILTLHVSKGLEFDIVFALGLIHRTGIKDELIPVESEGQVLLTPISEDSHDYQRYCEEVDAEKMRQLYVALTRAKKQLYIPATLHLPCEGLTWGEASPMDLFLARLNPPPANSYAALYERIKEGMGKNFLEFLEKEGKKHSITYSLHQEFFGEIPRATVLRHHLSLHPPPHVSVRTQPLWMTSFSTLSRHLGYQGAEYDSVSSSFPRDHACERKNVHTLPAHRETGLLIHHILEKLNFEEFKELKLADQALPFVRPFVEKTPFKSWEMVIAHLIFQTLKTPLSTDLADFCLADLTLAQCYREMPFIFPYNMGRGLEEIECQEGFMKGAMDCLFYHDRLYYLVDWKTNWLGDQCEAYDSPFLEAAMEEHAYFLQAAIYMEAIRRYLHLVEKRPFEECFGGIFYLFLRGMQPGRKTGIYHWMGWEKKGMIPIPHIPQVYTPFTARIRFGQSESSFHIEAQGFG